MSLMMMNNRWEYDSGKDRLLYKFSYSEKLSYFSSVNGKYKSFSIKKSLDYAKINLQIKIDCIIKKITLYKKLFPIKMNIGTLQMKK
jgi:hypothetical protein